MDFSVFIGNLKTHEMERKVGEERKPQKKKSIVFKATPAIPDKQEVDEFAIGKIFYKKSRIGKPRRSRWQGKVNKRKILL